MFDETNNVEVIQVESEDSESEVESEGNMHPNDFQTAWFNAKEMEETKTTPGSFKAVKKNLKDESYSIKYKSKKQSPQKHATKSEKSKKPPAITEEE